MSRILRFAYIFIFAFLLSFLLTADALSHRGHPLRQGSKGVAVKSAEWQLAGNNVFKIKTFKGKPNRIYDADTVRATRAMKWRLGYPKNDLKNGRFGHNLRLILMGKRKRPPYFRVRAASRMKSVTLQRSYPLRYRGAIIGTPFAGTHRLGNYQSDNAVDIACRRGTPVLAPINGRLFGGYGSLGRGGRFLGLRINMTGTYKGRSVSFYLAHMMRLVVLPGRYVRAGQVVGYCGQANGIYHLHMGSSYGFPILNFVLGRY